MCNLLVTFSIGTLDILVSDTAVIKQWVWLQSPVLGLGFAWLVVLYLLVSSNDWFVNLIFKITLMTFGGYQWFAGIQLPHVGAAEYFMYEPSAR